MLRNYMDCEGFAIYNFGSIFCFFGMGCLKSKAVQVLQFLFDVY
jgi:hypothetical protein